MTRQQYWHQFVNVGFATAVVCCVFSVRCPGEPIFPAQVFITGDSPAAVTFADLDLDGDADLVATNSVDNTVVVRPNDGSGSFGDAVVASTGARPTSMALGDLDADGLLDVVVGQYLAESVGVLRSTGGGQFGSRTDYPVGGRPVGVAVTSLDSDGHMDLVVGCQDGRVLVFPGESDGMFGESVLIWSGAGVAHLVTDDFDADGDQDCLAIEADTGRAVFLRNDGGLVFESAAFTILGFQPTGLDTADIDADGRVDCVLSDASGDRVVMLRGDGIGGFGPLTSIAQITDPNEALIVDLDNDGHLDVLVGTNAFRAGGVWILRGQGPGRGFASEGYEVGAQVTGVAAADLNGDGTLDLGLRAAGSDRCVVLLADDRQGFVVRRSIPAGNKPVALRAGDLNGDGFTDLVTANESDDELSIMLSTGEPGQFTITPRFAGSLPVNLALIDLDNDADLDIVAGTRSSHGLGVWLNRGDGTFGLRTKVPAGSEVRWFDLSDIDGDGDQDAVIVCAHSLRRLISVYVNNGGGGLTLHETIEITTFPEGIEVGDFDRDGDPDIVITGGEAEPSIIWANDGSGRFVSADGPIFLRGTESLLCVDVNGDGVEDILASAPSADQLGLLLGKPSGGFVEPILIIPARGVGLSLVVADFTGDNIADIAAESFDGWIGLYTGDGHGGFEQSAWFAGGFERIAMAAADMNSDAKPDLLVADAWTDAIHLLLNQSETVDCGVDLDHNNVLNFADVLSFLQIYGFQGLGADFAEPFGSLNFFDVAAFLAAYNAGCP